MLLQKTAFITGAAQGLGKAFSEALLARGARVCLTDVQAKKGFLVEKELQEKYGKEKCMFLQCDVTSPSVLEQSFKTAVRIFGHIDLVVNNAGIANEARLVDTININLIAAIQGSKLAQEHMRIDKGGKGGIIINVASTAGLIPVYYTPTYSASKYGLVGFHSSCANDPHLREMGVQFGCLCPAFTDTDIIRVDESMVLYIEESREVVKQMGLNKVETVVEAFLQLVESPNCNGDIITVTRDEGIKYKKIGKNKWTSRL